MKITADTNILVRLITADDPLQSDLAKALVEKAELIAMPLTALAELCWVLERAYGFPKNDVARALRALTNAANAAVDTPAVEAGLAMLDAGGDFADGAIAQEGFWLGADVFMSFDRKAVRLIEQAGMTAQIPQ